MGWKGTLRSMAAASRRAAREAEKRDRARRKRQEIEDAAETVSAFENYVENLTKIHMDVETEYFDWQAVLEWPEPSQPEPVETRQAKLRTKYESFSPHYVVEKLRMSDWVHRFLKWRLEKAIEKDLVETNEKIKAYTAELEHWREYTEIARGLATKEAKSYLRAIELRNPLQKISALGSSINIRIDDQNGFYVDLHVHGEDVIPNEKYSLRKSGTLAVKNMPKGEYYALYQDYVCSAVFRISRELFALLPIKALVISAMDDLLNSATGHLEEQPLVSVFIPRDTAERLNWSHIDPTEALTNFNHNMQFRKTQGFSPTQVMAPSTECL